MLVSEILATVKPAYAENWPGVKAYFDENPSERERVDKLKAIMAAGQLREGGRLDYDDEEGCYYLGNGTHRFVAAWELGWEDFPVNQGVGEKKQEPFYDLTTLRLHWSAPPAAQEKAFEISWSFELDEAHWAESDGMATRGIGKGVEIELAFIPLPEELYPRLVEEVIKRLEAFAPRSTISYITVALERSYDDEFFNVGDVVDKDELVG